MAMNKLRGWLRLATPDEIKKLAIYAKTSVAVLRQIGGGYRTQGAARTTPETAQAISKATRKLARDGLPAIKQEDLCPACRTCSLRCQ